MSDISPASRGPVIRIADLGKDEPRRVSFEPDDDALSAIARVLGLDGLRKFRFHGTLAPLGKRDWQLKATLGATVVQPCVVTLAPVTTRIDEPVERIWRADWHEPEGEEVELPERVDEDPLGAEIDIAAVAIEALALALPDFPRAEAADLGAAVFTEPGKPAMTDEDARPFAGLAALRDKLAGEGED